MDEGTEVLNKLLVESSKRVGELHVYKVIFLENTVNIKGENSHEVAYYFGLVLLVMKKLRKFSEEPHQRITVTDTNFIRIYDVWKNTHNDKSNVEVECVRSMATQHYLESLDNSMTISCSSTTDTPHDDNPPQQYVSQVKTAWTNLLTNTVVSKASDLQPVMQSIFGHATFQLKQQEALDLILAGKNVFVSLPTAGGKSLLYMLPAIVTCSLTVVVAPLKSLIEDQFKICQDLGLPAAAAVLHGDIVNSDKEKIYAEMRKENSEIRLLYLTPEVLSTNQALMDFLIDLHTKQKLRQFVVDEAHCVTQWGKDFRPAYQFLNTVHAKFPDIQFLLLGASSPASVRENVCKVIGLSNIVLVESTYSRNNLQYQVFQKSKKSIEEIAVLLAKEGCGLVYCNTRAETEVVAAKLQTANIKCKAYHGGLSAAFRKNCNCYG